MGTIRSFRVLRVLVCATEHCHEIGGTQARDLENRGEQIPRQENSGKASEIAEVVLEEY